MVHNKISQCVVKVLNDSLGQVLSTSQLAEMIKGGENLELFKQSRFR